MKRIVLTLLMLGMLCGTCYAEQWVDIYNDVPGLAQVDLDSVRTMTIGYDNVTRCIIKLTDRSNGEYFVTTELIDSDNTTYCDQLTVQYNKAGKEMYRLVHDPNVMRNWAIYNNTDTVALALKRVQ